MNNINEVDYRLKVLRDELFELRFEQKMTRDDYTLGKLKERETMLIKEYKELLFIKLNNEDNSKKKKK